ncbi:response regulator [Exilibacterium tricleocarpae]|uniref:histidine kinase n=1 Tax=Exilibacterium tricleocarpae TaxID=2591008 RepID=A0A545SY84_9GAMM|nr:7TM diverse intracellular signaling domain-containing protein [Exilibacterium tricleocarpae]TQV69927.1 response regulator [Exilibacterium tricleocarpae]
MALGKYALNGFNMVRGGATAFWFILCVLGFMYSTFADTPGSLVVSETHNHYATLGYIEYLEDKVGSWTLSDVKSMAGPVFTRVEKSAANFGIGTSTYWFRLSVTNAHPHQEHWWLEVQNPLLDLIDTYVIRSDSEVTHARIGDSLPISNRSIRVRNPTFELNLNTGETVKIYLRIKTTGLVSVPIFVSRPEVFAVSESHKQMWIGLCYGAIAALLLYNLILFLSALDISYLYYCFCIASFVAFQAVLDGLAYEYVWPDNGDLNYPVNFLLVGLCIASVLLFTRHFLRGAVIFPLLNRLMFYHSFLTLMHCAIWLAVGVTPLALQTMSVLAFGAIFMAIATTVIAMRQGIIEARYFLLAWLCLLAGLTSTDLMIHGVLPASVLTARGVQIGSTLAAVLLSFALAHRMRTLMQENTCIQTEAKVNLERRVRERTLALDRATNELGEANRLLVEGNTKVVEANQAKSEFIAAASHDLRQPLQALGFYLRILYDKAPGVDEVLVKCRSAFRTLESLLKSLLDISKLDSNTVQANIQHVAISEIFERLQNDNDYTARLKRLRLTFRRTDCTVLTDPQKLECILTNLIENAIRHTNKGGVLVCGRTRKYYLLLQVWDTGPGIPEEEHDNIFQEFYQLKSRTQEQGQDPGLGLGLAIVKRLTTLLNISINLRSKIGKGAVFSLQVPYDHSSNSLSPPAGSINLPLGQHIVALIIDDDITIRDSMTLLIESWGGVALAVGSSKQAICAITEEQIVPDIIIADYWLGDDKTGVEVVKTLYAKLQREIPTVIITGETSSDSMEAIYAFGKDCLHKPVDPDKLKQIISNLIKHQQSTPAD